MKKILLRTLRIVRTLLLVFTALIFLLSWLISLPFVQNKIASYTEQILETALGTDVEVGEVGISFPVRAYIKDLVIYDKQHQTFIKAETAWMSMINVSLWQLVFQTGDETQIGISGVTLDKADINIYKSRKDGKLNLSFLSEGKKSDKPGRAISLNFPVVTLRETNFTYRDSTKSDSLLAITGKLNFSNMQYAGLNGQVSWSLNADKVMKLAVARLKLKESRSGFTLDDFSGILTYGMSKGKDSKPSLKAENISFNSGSTHLTLDAGIFPTAPGDTSASGYNIGFNFKNTAFNLSLINYFTGKDDLNGTIVLNGLLTGNENHLNADSLQIYTAGDTRVKAAIKLNDYTTKDFTWTVLFAENSVLDFDELQSLMPNTNIQLRGISKLKGKVDGTLGKLFTQNLEVNYGRDTYLKLNGSVKKFTSGDSLEFDMAYTNSRVNFVELKQLLPVLRKQDLPPELDKMGPVVLNGTYKGGIKDFYVNTGFVTTSGSGKTNVHFKLPPLVARPEYEGELTTYALNVDKIGISNVIKSSNLNFEGKIKGKGFKFAETDMIVSGIAIDSDLWGNHIDTLESKEVLIDSGRVTGDMEIRDRQGNASFFTNTNLISSPKVIVVRGDIEKVDLSHYVQATGDCTLITTLVNINLSGDSLENFTGKTSFENIMLFKPDKHDSIALRKFTFRSEENTLDTKNFTLASSVVNLSLKGEFSFKDGIHWISRITKEAELYIGGNADSTAKYYAEKVIRTDTLGMKVSVSAQPELQKVLDFFSVPAHIASGSSLQTNIVSSRTDKVEIIYNGDFISYGGDSIFVESLTKGGRGDSLFVSSVRGVKPDVVFSIDKDARKNELLGSGEVKFDTVTIGDKLSFEKVVIEPIMADNTVEYSIKGKQQSLGNQFYFNAETVFLPGGIVSRVNPQVSGIDLGDQKWRVSQTNKIIFSDGEITVKELRFSNGDQTFSLNGIISDDREDILKIVASKVPIPEVMALVTDTVILGGIIDTLSVSMTSVMNEPNLTAYGRISGFSYGKIDSVDIIVDGFWESRRISEFLALHTTWYYHNTSALELTGSYDLRNEKLDFHADSSAIPLEWVSPFLEPNVSNLRGTAYVNKFTITGKPTSPLFRGSILFKDAGAKIEFLGADVQMEEMATIRFNNDSIIIPDITIYDPERNTAKLSGNVIFPDGGSPKLNLLLDRFNKFTMLNTTKEGEGLFYGKATVASGYVRIKGTLKKAEITADISPAEGTEIDIPISYYTQSQRPKFVRFINDDDQGEAPFVPELSGFELNLLLRANPNATIRLIFDEQVGDMIKASGDGDINLLITEDGEFTMQGDFIVAEGDYLFTAENIVNKKFKVDKNSHITWSQNPYDAKLFIDARYPVKASLTDLIGTDNAGNIDVDIIMHLRGTLTAPIITLELAMKIDNATQQDVMGLDSYFSNIQYDEQELNRQVVSLLMFRRFAPQTNYFDAKNQANSSGGGITSSISELISNQVNYWLSQAINANVGVEVKTNKFQDVELGIKASLFNERVTIERNGTIIGNRSGQVSIGDITVLIKILPVPPKTKPVDDSTTVGVDSAATQVVVDSAKVADPRAGQLVVEIFNRENAGLNNTYNNTTGSGIFYKKDFDTLRELFGKHEEGEIK